MYVRTDVLLFEDGVNKQAPKHDYHVKYIVCVPTAVLPLLSAYRSTSFQTDFPRSIAPQSKVLHLVVSLGRGRGYIDTCVEKSRGYN